MSLVTERFDARERSAKFHRAIGEDAFPPWLIHADPASDVWWDRVRSWFPEFQVVLVDDGQPVAAGWAVPIAWDGTVADLPAGYTTTLQRAVQGREAATGPDALVVCDLAARPCMEASGSVR